MVDEVKNLIENLTALTLEEDSLAWVRRPEKELAAVPWFDCEIILKPEPTEPGRGVGRAVMVVRGASTVVHQTGGDDDNIALLVGDLWRLADERAQNPKELLAQLNRELAGMLNLNLKKPE